LTEIFVEDKGLVFRRRWPWKERGVRRKMIEL
jgi:hypothetical protein